MTKDAVGLQRITEPILEEGSGKTFRDFKMFVWSLEGMNKFCGREVRCKVNKVGRG